MTARVRVFYLPWPRRHSGFCIRRPVTVLRVSGPPGGGGNGRGRGGTVTMTEAEAPIMMAQAA